MTAAALMIGVALISFVAVFVNGFKDSFLGAIDRSITSDMIVQGQNFQPIPAATVATVAQVPGVQTATGILFAEAKINNGGTDTVNGVDPATFGDVYQFDWLNGGSNKDLTNLGPDQALIEQQFAKSHNLSTGDTFNLTSIDGNHLHLTVAGEYKDPNLMTGLIIPDNTLATFSPGSRDPGLALVSFDPGPQGHVAERSIRQALKSFPVGEGADERRVQEVDRAAVQRHPAAALHPACDVPDHLPDRHRQHAGVVGVRAHPRDRHAASGRHDAAPAAAVIRYESSITAIIGGVLGISVGLLFGWIVARGLSDQGLVFIVPYRQLVVVPDRRDVLRRDRGDPASAPRREAERAGGAAVRVR